MGLENLFAKDGAFAHAIAKMHQENGARGDTRRRLMVYPVVTGAGLGVSGILSSVGGASATLYDFQEPYNQAALIRFLGRSPFRFNEFKAVSKATALDMACKAMAEAAEGLPAYRTLEALKEASEGPTSESVVIDRLALPRVAGIGFTGAIATVRERRGADQFFLALQYPSGADSERPWNRFTVEGVFERGTWDRDSQNQLCRALIINLALWAMGLDQVPIRSSDLPGKLFSPEQQFVSGGTGRFVLRPTPALETFRTPAGGSDPLTVTNLFERPFFGKDGVRLAELPDRPQHVFLCASLRYITAAHRWMADRLREETLAQDITFLLEAVHPDKGAADADDLLKRITECLGREEVFLTQGLGYFADKSKRFPNAIFGIGYDVAEKLVDPANGRRLGDLAELKRNGAAFYVFGRRKQDEGTGHRTLRTIADLRWMIPADYQELFRAMDGESPDISSTEQRAALGPPKKD